MILQRSCKAAVARHIGGPGTIHNFNQLTGGANKNTYSFEADVGAERLHLVLQIPGKPKEDEPNPLEGVMPRVTADEDARLMIAAHDAGVPAPKVRAIFDGSDEMDPGYITEFVAGETLATKILREDRFRKSAHPNDGAMREDSGRHPQHRFEESFVPRQAGRGRNGRRILQGRWTCKTFDFLRSNGA